MYAEPKRRQLFFSFLDAGAAQYQVTEKLGIFHYIIVLQWYLKAPN